MANTAISQKPKFSVALQTDMYQKLIHNTLKDPDRAKRFIASISSAVAINPDLQACDPGTILSGALLGESLNLSPSPQLGQFYLVPFKDNRNNRTVATFVLGYKGYLQLAMRSGQYKSIVVKEIKNGELVKWDEFTETIKIAAIEDPVEREAAETIGYYASFEYLNGFVKRIYWSKAKMENHAMKYSAGYRAKKGYTFWEKSFDDMALKTLIRQLISKWGIMSIEIRDALEYDSSVINGDGTAEFINGDDIPVSSTVAGQPVNVESAKEEPQELTMSDI